MYLDEIPAGVVEDRLRAKFGFCGGLFENDAFVFQSLELSFDVFYAENDHRHARVIDSVEENVRPEISTRLKQQRRSVLILRRNDDRQFHFGYVQLFFETELLRVEHKRLDRVVH